MKLFLNILFLLGAHFNFTPFAPAKDKAWFFWPFAENSKPLLSFVGGLPNQSGSILTPLLAGLAGICFLVSFMANMGWWVPSSYLPWAVGVGAASSIVLYILYFTPFSILPILLDILLLVLLYSKRIGA